MLRDKGFTQWDYVEVAVVLGLCCLFAYLRWLKIDSLVWLDPARWLFECFRVAKGEVPYRDFSLQYPPFVVFLFGYVLKWFGIRFAVAEILIDLISLLVVGLTYSLMRLLLPREVRLAAMFLFIAVSATTQTKFNLFSFSTYVPSLETGAAGCLMVLLGMILYLRSGVLKLWYAAIVIVGSFVAAYSKPESLVGSWAVLLLVAIADRRFWFRDRPGMEWARHYLLFLAACIIPSLLAYGWIALVVGRHNLKEGVTGYGLASHACPWWPTGLGLFGAAAALGQAAFFVGCLALTKDHYFAARFGRTYRVTQILAAMGGMLYFAYFVYLNWNLFSTNRIWTDRLRYSLPTILWTNAVLIPVMWVAICWCVYLLFVFAKNRFRDINGKSLETLVLLLVPVIMSLRGLFNTTLDKVTEVSAICYPFFLLLASYLLWRLIEALWPPEDVQDLIRTSATRAVIILYLAYGLLRMAGAYDSLSNKMYGTIHTLAGDIRSKDYSVDSKIYAFVMKNTSPGDMVLDIPYGGGMNVASGLKSPVFTTQFQQLKMPDEYMQDDLQRIRRHPPRVVIAQDEVDYGASYGLEQSSCTFPRFVWIAPENFNTHDKKFPALEFIRENYHVVQKIGPKLLLMPNEGKVD